MRKFLYKCLLFLCAFAIMHIVLFITKPEGQKGKNYERHASPKTYSMVCGTSMAAQDINPKILYDGLKEVYDSPPYNYSFSIDESPYGAIYFDAIKQKVLPNDKHNSLFILCVDPFSLGFTTADTLDLNCYREEKHVLAKLRKLSGSPNLEYYFRYLLFEKDTYRFVPSTNAKIDLYGRFCSDVSYETDSMNVQDRISNTIIPYYRKFCVPNFAFSEERLHYLTAISEFMLENGDVYWVRPVVGADLTMIMDSICPQFDSIMEVTAKQCNIPYFNFHDRVEDFHTTDGVHLYRSEGDIFTSELVDSITLCLQSLGTKGEN